MQLAAGKSRAMKDDVVSLPLRRWARSVHLRRILPVHSGRLAVSVSLVLVRVEHLNLVEAQQKNAAVASLLALSLARGRLRKLHVQLAISERIARGDVAGLGHDFHVAIFDL